MRIPVWTGGRERRSFLEDFGEGPSSGPRSTRSSIQEIDRVLRDSERVLRDSERVLSGEAERLLDDPPTTPGPFPDPLGEVQRVTLSVEGRENNNSPSHIEATLRFPLLEACNTFYHNESESTFTTLLLNQSPCTALFLTGPWEVLYTKIQRL